MLGYWGEPCRCVGFGRLYWWEGEWHSHISHHPTLVATADPVAKLRLYGFQILGPLQHRLSFLLWWWDWLAIANHCQGLPSLMPRGGDFQGAELGLMVSEIRSRISLEIWTGLKWLHRGQGWDISRWESSSWLLPTSSQNRTLSWGKGCLSVWSAQLFPTVVCWVAKHSLWTSVQLDPTWVCWLATHSMNVGCLFVK
jgi:hypothetical protein